MDKKDLLDLINDDDLGLLDMEKKSIPITSDDRLIESFIEINEFFSLHNVEPKSGGDIHEHKLASRLKHIRENSEQQRFLKEYDKYGLLERRVKDIENLSDLFEDDDTGILSFEEDSIFNLQHVPNVQTRKNADFVAKRKSCKDFHKFEELFIDCHKNLKNGFYSLADLEKHLQVKVGTFFVLGGVLGFVQNIENLKINDQNKINGRMRVVFENGTESNLLLQSLVRALQKEGGKLVVANEKNIENITDEDKESGYIYILKSLSTDPSICILKNLYKVGFSTTSVEKRIQNAQNDPTYLMAPVSIVSIYQFFNMNPQRFERLLHRFFIDSCLDLEIIDKEGKKYVPKEWFSAPVAQINEAIDLILKGEIVNYVYDKKTQEILKK